MRDLFPVNVITEIVVRFKGNSLITSKHNKYMNFKMYRDND